MADPLQVIQLGNPILRTEAQSIQDIQSVQIQTLIDDLIATAIQTNGVGIAAPQVSASHRLFIVASRPNLRYPNAPTMEPMAVINPVMTAHSDEVVKDWEGCLSIPGIRALVPRYRAIAVEYTDRTGKVQKQELTDFVARIFQHELDHLNGRVFLDRVENTFDIVTEQEYLKQIFQ